MQIVAQVCLLKMIHDVKMVLCALCDVLSSVLLRALLTRVCVIPLFVACFALVLLTDYGVEHRLPLNGLSQEGIAKEVT